MDGDTNDEFVHNKGINKETFNSGKVVMVHPLFSDCLIRFHERLYFFVELNLPSTISSSFNTSDEETDDEISLIFLYSKKNWNKTRFCRISYDREFCLIVDSR